MSLTTPANKATSLITPDDDAIISEIEIAAPPARVFDALTAPAQLMQWFTDVSCPAKYWNMDARLGGRYSYASENSKLVINGVSEFTCHGEITEIHKDAATGHYLLVYTWLANWHLDKDRRTVVRWELTPTSSGTRVRVTHSGLAEEPEARKDYSGGWIGVVNNLKQFAETGKPLRS
jgi:uncharacterized protein YndB with AHSA1/START domain